MQSMAITIPMAKQGIKPILSFKGPDSAMPENQTKPLSVLKIFGAFISFEFWYNNLV